MVSTEEIVQRSRQRKCSGCWSEENQGTAATGQLKVPETGAGAEEGARWERERWGGGAGPPQVAGAYLKWGKGETGRKGGYEEERGGKLKKGMNRAR